MVCSVVSFSATTGGNKIILSVSFIMPLYSVDSDSDTYYKLF